MPQRFTFKVIGQPSRTYHDDVYQDFHAYVSDITYHNNGTFTRCDA
jgi:hypothetical protein